MAQATSSDPNGVQANITTNNKGWFQAVSPQFLELTGRPVEALAGVNLGDLIHPEDAAAVRAALAAAAVGNQPTAVGARLFSADDRWLELRLNVRSIGDDRLRVDLLHEPSQTAVRAESAASGGASVPTDADEVTKPPIATTASASHAPLAEFLAGQPANTAVLPATPVAVYQDLPHDDSPDHLAYIATLPGDDVPAQRAAVRADAGRPDTPLIEVDPQGRTVFLSGDWSSLSIDDAVGADAFEEFLGRSGRADQVLDAMAAVFASAEPSQHELAVPGWSPRWARVVPIPSPHRAGAVNAMIAVVTESMLDRPGVAVAAPPPDPRQPDLTSAAPVDAERAATADALDADRTKADAVDEAVIAEAAARPRTAAAKWTRWLVWVLVGVVALLALNNLIGGDADDPEKVEKAEPIRTELLATDAAQVSDTQVWRQVGAAAMGEIYGIAATDDGAVVADIQGRIIRLDEDGASVGASGLSGGSDTFVSDLAHAGSGTVWVLDAGLGQLSTVSTDGTVTRVESNPDPLRNARGLGAGSDDTLWVASTAASQLTQLGADGSLIGTIPLPGRQPSDVVELDDGSLWVVDAQEIELVHVAADGEIVNTVPLESFSSVQSPHLAVADGRLWVTEPDGSAMFAVELDTDQISSERIQISRPDGAAVVRPIGIDVGPDGRLWIVDSMGAGIVIVDG